jgi:hypothetical protein
LVSASFAVVNTHQSALGPRDGLRPVLQQWGHYAPLIKLRWKMLLKRIGQKNYISHLPVLNLLVVLFKERFKDLIGADKDNDK